MNFKDFQFSIGKLKADVHSQIARNNPLHKQDTKALSLWIYQERTDLASMRTITYERSETIKALKAWIKEQVEEESNNAEDLQDIVGDKLCRLFEKQVEIEQQFAEKYQQYRHAIKSIREREEKLSEHREKRRSLQSRIKSNPKLPKLAEFQKELKQLQEEAQDSEMDLADFKRFALKEAFYLRLNAMSEYAEKIALIAGFGRYLTDLIDIEPTETPTRRPYEKASEATTIVNDAMQAVEEWKPKDERPTLVDQDKKGKSVETPTPTITNNPPPPELPPRPHSFQEEHSPVSPQLPPRPQDKRKSIDRIELFDPPPPAYQDESPAQSFTTVYYQQPNSPYSTQSPILLPESPGPIYIQQQIIHPFSPPMMYSQMNYSQLYRQVSQRQQHYYHRPYSEFQQQQRQRIDAEPSAPPALLL